MRTGLGSMFSTSVPVSTTTVKHIIIITEFSQESNRKALIEGTPSVVKLKVLPRKRTQADLQVYRPSRSGERALLLLSSPSIYGTYPCSGRCSSTEQLLLLR